MPFDGAEFRPERGPRPNRELPVHYLAASLVFAICGLMAFGFIVAIIRNWVLR